MEKSKLTPDPVRDPPVGEYQCPGGHMILPARAYGDERFNRFPMTFRALGICSAHANSWTGIFFVNQSTIARILGSSQQAISQHMTRLIEYGYLEKLRNADIRRKYGKKGALWRVIYDPATTDEDILARYKPEFVEQQDAEETLKVIAKSQPDVDKVKKSTDTKVNLEVDQQAKKVNLGVDQNYSTITNSTSIREISMKICKVYARERETRLGSMVGWQNDERQIAIVEKYLAQGHSKNTILKTFLTSLNHYAKSGKRPPFSLGYYDTYFNKKEKPSVQDIIKKTANRSRFTAVRKPR